jgi:hypothetical protein
MTGQEHYYTIHGPRVTEPWLGIRDSSLDVPANRSCVALSIDIQRGFAENQLDGGRNGELQLYIVTGVLGNYGHGPGYSRRL